MLYLVADYPRGRWAEPSPNDIARHWPQNPQGFRRAPALGASLSWR